MTLEQVQQEVAALSDDERLRLAAFLKHLNRVNSKGNRAELSRLNRAIDAGDYVSLDQLEQAHVKLQSEGR